MPNTIQTKTEKNGYIEYVDVFMRDGIITAAGKPNFLLCFDTEAHSTPLAAAKSPEGFKLYQKVCIYIQEGYFSLEINNNVETIHAGHLLTVMPESIIRTIDKDPDLEYFAIVIYPQLSNNTYKDLGVTYSNAQLSQRYFISPMSAEQMEQAYTIYSEIKKDLMLPEYKYQNTFLRSMLNALYIENINIHRYNPMPLNGNCNSHQYDIYCKFLTALNKHSQEHRDVQYYAKLLNISSKYLSFICIGYSKKNASTWIDESVIQKAKTLMTVHKYNTQQTSEILHFPAVSCYRRFFKRVTGMTTGEYLNSFWKDIQTRRV